MTETDHTPALRARLAGQITGADDPWRATFEQVPRHLFVPEFLQKADGQGWQAVTADAPGYFDAVYSDRALTTQVTDDEPTSSSSEPSLMLAMLRALDVQDGQHVLEVGTGTGYNAALLSQRFGDKQVTTIDVDPALTGPAAERLALAGHRPTVRTGDGAAGAPDRAPFERIIATCGLPFIPQAWIDQAAEGAVIVLPIGWGVARLTVHAGRAAGRFLTGPAHFMQRRVRTTPPRFDEMKRSQARSTPVALAGLMDRIAFPLSLALPGYHSATWTDENHEPVALGLWTPDGSAAHAGADGTVREAGAGIWAIVERLNDLFPMSPAREDFGLTITPARQHAWYRSPHGPSWDLQGQ